jgi:hypothetical protein
MRSAEFLFAEKYCLTFAEILFAEILFAEILFSELPICRNLKN